MKIPLYNLKGETVGETEVSDDIFGRRWNGALVKQVLLAQQANRRQPLAHTKTRGEVSGGGRKPWRQKHTGRARHGSIRSPIWKGGGVTHGPRKERDFSQKVNRKMRRTAIHAALSRKLRDGELRVIDSLAASSPKTKDFAPLVQPYRSALLVPSQANKLIFRVSRNIPKMYALRPQSLNVEDILKYKNVLIEQGAVAEIR